MTLACQRCKQTHTGPQAFLLTCRGCTRSWHHRCHMPPIEDDQLIRLIRATNAGDKANDLTSWMCRRCKKGTSATLSSMSSREQTASRSSESREDSKRLVASSRQAPPSTSTANVVSTADVRVKQEPTTATVDARLASDRERNKGDGPGLAEASKRTFTAKRTKPSAANQLHVQPQPGPAQPRDSYEDVQMGDITPAESIPQEKKRSPQRPSSPSHSHQVKAARKFGSTVSATSIEEDVDMHIDSPPSRASMAPSSKSVAEAPPHVRASSSASERGREVRPANIDPQVNQVPADEGDDDPEDLYGPPVERRIIRILPSLAEELREQQRRVAAEKEKRRTPLAPDWIYARHANDPLWKEIPAQGRKRRKATARKLGDNGLNVNELMGYYTVQNWVREHKV